MEALALSDDHYHQLLAESITRRQFLLCADHLKAAW
jgi:hypothetical protein